MNRTQKIVDIVTKIFPNADCELIFHNNFELLCAVMLSAQTTDKSVNKVTPQLFSLYPDAYAMANADLTIVENCIKQIGLYKSKAKNLINLSMMLVDNFSGEVPGKMDDLLVLPGVGRKTSNVVLALGFGIPAIAVDTHVKRVSIRLQIAEVSDDEKIIEQKLMRDLPQQDWIKAHHALLFFGRYQCFSQRPNCQICQLKEYCRNKENAK